MQLPEPLLIPFVSWFGHAGLKRSLDACTYSTTNKSHPSSYHPLLRDLAHHLPPPPSSLLVFLTMYIIHSKPQSQSHKHTHTPIFYRACAWVRHAYPICHSCIPVIAKERGIESSGYCAEANSPVRFQMLHWRPYIVTLEIQMSALRRVQGLIVLFCCPSPLQSSGTATTFPFSYKSQPVKDFPRFFTFYVPPCQQREYHPMHTILQPRQTCSPSDGQNPWTLHRR